MSFISRSKSSSRAQEIRSASGRSSEEETPSPSLKASDTKTKRQQSAYHDERLGVWRCRNCGWNYPNPNPNAHVRREHKKHCQGARKVQHWLIDSRHGSQGSAEDTENLRDDSKDQKSIFLERLDTSSDHPVAMREVENSKAQSGITEPEKTHASIEELLEKVPDMPDLILFSDDEPVDQKPGDNVLTEKAEVEESEPDHALMKKTEVEETEPDHALMKKTEVEDSEPDYALMKKTEVEENEPDHVMMEKTEVENEPSLIAGDDEVKQKAELGEEIQESESDHRRDVDAPEEKAEVAEEVEVIEPGPTADADALNQNAGVLEEVEGSELSLVGGNDRLEQKAEVEEEVEDTEPSLIGEDADLKQKTQKLEETEESAVSRLTDDDALKGTTVAVQEVEEMKPGLPADDIALEEKSNVVPGFDEWEPQPTVGDDLLTEKAEIVEEMGTSEESLIVRDEGHQEKAEGVEHVEKLEDNQSLQTLEAKSEYLSRQDCETTGAILEPYLAKEDQKIDEPPLKDDDLTHVSGEGEFVETSDSGSVDHALKTGKGIKEEEREGPDRDEQQPVLMTTSVDEPFVSGVTPPEDVVPGTKLSEVESSDQDEGRRVVQSTGETSSGPVKLTSAERNWDDWDDVVRDYMLTESRILPSTTAVSKE